MVSSEKKLANAMGGKTARACDSCIRKRARWYCAADDVFLCQFCDSLVHSANPLARCHQSVRLKIASMEIPTWHQGFTKKSRTPRGKNSNKYGSNRIPNSDETVPEIGSDELNAMNSDEKLPYQVPEFDPFSGELCFSGDFDDMMVPIQSDDYTKTPSDTKGDDESEVPFPFPFDLNSLILPSDLELAEFAADVESLLGKGLDEEYSLEMVDQCRINMDSERVKVEEEMMMMMSFDYDSAVVAWEEEDDDEKGKGMVVKNKSVVVDDNVNNIINYVDDKIIIKKMLKLDYEGIIAAWDDERSPWATGDRPELDCLLDCMHFECGDMGKVRLRLDGGREARVSRYREKRRRRLFSKKIRYQVRKLNAEKRPRIKGRFVKRPSFADTTTTASGFSLLST